MKIIRTDFTESSTIGNLLVDGFFFCHTLEDKDRQRQPDGSIIPWATGLKVPKETAIPYGSYELITNYSNRFKKVMPLLKAVPNFTGVRIHNGNTSKHTEGCILVGYTKEDDFIGQSLAAFHVFMQILTKKLKAGPVRLTIEGKI